MENRIDCQSESGKILFKKKKKKKSMHVQVLQLPLSPPLSKYCY